MDKKTVFRVGLAGCGTVGGGVLEIVLNRAAALEQRTGVRFEAAKVFVRNMSRKRSVTLDAGVFTDSLDEFLATDLDLVVEVIGGTDVARDVVLGALKRKVPVVTANKALLAMHGADVYRTAHENGVSVAFEASVAGGLPIIGAALRGLMANRCERVVGIFNSTCNFVLSEMLLNGVSYDAAVKAAQQAGYAEADPTLDVSGADTAHKLAVISSLLFGANVDLGEIRTTGIDRLTLEDLSMAAELGYACKLLGVATRIGDQEDGAPRLHLTVQPMLLPSEHVLAGLTGSASGVCVWGDAVGETVYIGAGAGSLPTASAVVADMIETATGSAAATFERLRVYSDRTPSPVYVGSDDIGSAYFVRLNIEAGSGGQAEMEGLWRREGVTLSSAWTLEGRRTMVAVTEQMPEKTFRRALQQVASGLHLTGQPSVLRVFAE